METPVNNDSNSSAKTEILNVKPLNRMLVVLKKEVTEIFRDKRTRFSVVISPLLITPLLFAVMGKVISSQTDSNAVQKLSIGLVSNSQSSSVERSLQSDPNIIWKKIERDAIEASVKSRSVNAVVELPTACDDLVSQSKTAGIKVYFDAGNDSSTSASNRVETLFATLSQQVVKQRLTDRNLPADLASPFKIQPTPIQSGGSIALLILSGLLPYMLAISALSGGILSSNDLVAGEKERGTLETLLVTPASRKDIVLGKYCAVATVCLTCSLLSVLGLMIPFYSHLPAYNWLTRGGSLSLSPTSVLAILLVQLPLAVLFAGVLLAISTYSRNQKEAQTYLGPVMILVIIPSMMSMFVKSDAAISYAVIPVLNATLVLKQALAGSFNGSFLGIAVVASITYASMALALVVKMFQKESILLKA